jgi:hypothetical protein
VKRPHVSEKLRAYYADPANRCRHIERMRQPKTRAKISDGVKAAMSCPEVRQRQKLGLRLAWADPGKRLQQAQLTRERIATARKRAELST